MTSTSRSAFAAAMAMVTVATIAACGGSPGGGTAAPPASEIARIHHARCGACHVRVEPGERSRAALEAALARHHTRVHLRDEQWREMIDYLAAAPPPAELPAAPP